MLISNNFLMLYSMVYITNFKRKYKTLFPTYFCIRGVLEISLEG